MVYTREQMIRSESQEIKAKLSQFSVRALDEKTIQITYVSEVLYETLEVANRSSIWTKYSDGWRLRFHQGTAIHE